MALHLCSYACARSLSRIRESHILFPLQLSGRRASGRAGERARAHTAGSYSHSDALGSSASLGAQATLCWSVPLSNKALPRRRRLQLGLSAVRGCVQLRAARLIVPIRVAVAPLPVAPRTRDRRLRAQSPAHPCPPRSDLLPELTCPLGTGELIGLPRAPRPAACPAASAGGDALATQSLPVVQ